MSDELTRCPKCGAPHEPNARFCEACGVRFATSSCGSSPDAPAVPSSEAVPASSRPACSVRTPDVSDSVTIPGVIPPVRPSIKNPTVTVTGPVPPTVTGPVPPAIPTVSIPGVSFRAMEERSSEPLAQGELRVEFDALCVLFEGVHGMVRARLSHRAEDEFDNVVFRMRDKVLGSQRTVFAGQLFAFEGRPREFHVPVVDKSAGVVIWDILLEYDYKGMRHRMEGEWAVVVTGIHGARKCVENLVLNITNNIHTGHASEVHNSMNAADKLRDALNGGADIYETLRQIVYGGDRAWKWIDLYPCRKVDELPEMPEAAACESLVLDFGVHTVILLSKRVLVLGRQSPFCDILLHPPADATEAEKSPYRMMSRQHCRFAAEGSSVRVTDGVSDGRGNCRASSYGTFYNDERLTDSVIIQKDAEGFSTLSFGGRSDLDVIAVKAKILSPGALCEGCPRAGGDRVGCGNGNRPSLLLRRTDRVQACFVAVWSCVRLEEIESRFAGVKVFRQGQGFAWRCGRRCGWLVPGCEWQTEFGIVGVRKLEQDASMN